MPEALINAWDTVSGIGGSRMDAQALEAYLAATTYDAPLDMLYVAAGEKIAALTGAEAACVTGGTSAGILMATAACLTHGDEEAFCRLPAGTDARVVMLSAHKNPYAQAARWAGARLVERRNADMRGAAAFLYFAADKYTADGPSLRECTQRAQRKDIPMIVDAAAQLPPLENLTRYLDEGADIVLFSGGKAIGGPQSAGFALGSAVWMERIRRLTLLKKGLATLTIVGGMQIMGLLTALDSFLNGGCQAKMAMCEARCARMAQALEGLYETNFSHVTPLGQTYMRLILRPRCGAEILQERLAQMGAMVGVEAGGLCVNPWSLVDADEARLVAMLREVAAWA